VCSPRRGGEDCLILCPITNNQLTRVCVTLWTIWHAHRKAVHEDTFQSPLSTHCFIDKFLDDLELTKKPRVCKQPATHAQKLRTWLPPALGVAKINVDAGVRRGGGGGVLWQQ
jgi:hypothetical protein